MAPNLLGTHTMTPVRNGVAESPSYINKYFKIRDLIFYLYQEYMKCFYIYPIMSSYTKRVEHSILLCRNLHRPWDHIRILSFPDTEKHRVQLELISQASQKLGNKTILNRTVSLCIHLTFIAEFSFSGPPLTQ